MGVKERSGLILATFLILMVIQTTGQSERRTGNTCDVDVECPDNAWCKPGTSTKGYCVCKDGYIIQAYNVSHRECLKEAQTLGEACVVDTQCQSKMLLPALCIDGACQCKEGAHFDSGRCYDTALIGARCTVSQNCYIGNDDRPETQAFCVRGECTCTLLHSPRDGGRRCVKDAALGEPCEDNDQCVYDGLRCGEGICRCLENYAPHPLEPRCLPVTQELGGSCEVETQCRLFGSLAICEGGVCTCAWGSREASGKCWTIKVPGEDCSDSRECVTEEGGNGTCVQGACATRFTIILPQPSAAGIHSSRWILITATILLLLAS